MYGIAYRLGAGRDVALAAAGLFAFDNLVFVHSRIFTLDIVVARILGESSALSKTSDIRVALDQRLRPCGAVYMVPLAVRTTLSITKLKKPSD